MRVIEHNNLTKYVGRAWRPNKQIQVFKWRTRSQVFNEAFIQKKGASHPIASMPKTKKTFSGEEARTQYARSADAHRGFIHHECLV